MKIDILVKFCTLFSFQLQFQRDTPHLQIKSSLYVCRKGSGVPNLQTELNYLNSFKSYCIFSDFMVPMVSTLSPHCPHIAPTLSPSSPHCTHCSHHSHIIYMVPTSSSPSTYLLHPPLPTPRGENPRISKNSIRFELIEIFQFCLKI